MKPLVRLERSECLQLDRSLTREWIATNARGGYASSTVLLCPTRRFHGLLVTAADGLSKRHVFLSRFEETLSGAGKSFPISMGRYAGVWSPHGHQSIDHVELAPHPTFVYRIGGSTVVREVVMAPGSPTVLVRYAVRDVHTKLELRLRPLLPFRQADALTFENLALDPRTERIARGIRSRPYRSLPALALTANVPQRFDADPVWYRGIEYSKDLERGYGGHEDNFSPGAWVLELEPGAQAIVAATIGAPVEDPEAELERALEHAHARMRRFDGGLRGALEVAADDFLFQRDERARLAVLAGYPWQGEIGSDTFVALPAILLGRGEVERCGQALEDTLPYLRRGLMPSEFGATAAESSYESASASLWFARAVRMYDVAGGSRERVLDALRPALERIADEFHAGTDLDVHVDRHGLLHAGSRERAVTWMNSFTLAGPVTPRAGFAVETNALWYFLLRWLEELATRAGATARRDQWRRRRRLAGVHFLRRFWIESERYLADRWQDGVADTSVGANMVIASALEFSPLSRGKRTDVYQRARAELVTPRGLRTLAPTDPRYRGAHSGSHDEREEARHQGSVWPWLSSFYIETYLRAFGPDDWEFEPLSELVLGFSDLLSGYGLNHVSELYDGDPPHRPRGTIAHAVNTGELLRALRLLEEPPA